MVVVEDVLTTGGSTLETMEVAEAQGAEVVAAASIIDRGSQSGRLNVPLLRWSSWRCRSTNPSLPDVRAAQPVVKPGSRT